VSVATVLVAGDDGALDRAPTGDPPFLGSLVARLHAEFGADPAEIRQLAGEVLTTFATARVQSFVPILVEKNLRATYRARRDAGGPATAWAT
jgi:hypothetical protein